MSRRGRHRRAVGGSKASIDMNSLIDLTFLLLVTFMLTIPALEQGITNSVASCTLMVELGETLHFAKGSDRNIKLTTRDDLMMFKAYLKTERDTWLK